MHYTFYNCEALKMNACFPQNLREKDRIRVANRTCPVLFLLSNLGQLLALFTGWGEVGMMIPVADLLDWIYPCKKGPKTWNTFHPTYELAYIRLYLFSEPFPTALFLCDWLCSLTSVSSLLLKFSHSDISTPHYVVEKNECSISLNAWGMSSRQKHSSSFLIKPLLFARFIFYGQWILAFSQCFIHLSSFCP